MPDRRLAVLGSPIKHSKSPLLHAAAYDVLGLDWSYDREKVDEAGLAGYLDGRDDSWRGLSLTMPLKRAVVELVDDRHPLVIDTGQANTVLFEKGRRRAFNTDVHGVVAALAEAGVVSAARVVILGGGATAASAVRAAAELGAEQIVIAVRSPEKLRDHASLFARLSAPETVSIRPLDELGDAVSAADAVISTVPPGVTLPVSVPPLRPEQTLLDVAYEPWPTALAADWAAAGGHLAHGLDMLLHQALWQVRVFVNGDPDAALRDEDAVLGAMRAAVAR